MNLENSMLSKKSQSQEGKYCMIPLTGSTQSSHIHRESRMAVARGCGEGGSSYYLTGTEF